MAKLLKALATPIISELAGQVLPYIPSQFALQYALPVRSLSGLIFTRICARHSLLLEQAAVASLALLPGLLPLHALHLADENVLEVGYGHGDGLAFAYEKVKHGKGVVFGLERSRFMQTRAEKRFILHIREEAKIQLDQAFSLLRQ